MYDTSRLDAHHQRPELLLQISNFSCDGQVHFGINERLTIHPSLAATLTTGLTPQDAIAVTASCMAPSRHVSVPCLPHSLCCEAGLMSSDSFMRIFTIDVAMLSVDDNPVKSAPGNCPGLVASWKHLPCSEGEPGACPQGL